MKGLACSELHGLWAMRVQLPACSMTVSRMRVFCLVPEGRGGNSKHVSLSALRNVSQVAPALVAWTYSSPTRCRRERGRPVVLANVSFEFSPATAIVLTSALSFGLLRTLIYFRIEYIIAAMLGRHVPRGGARVVELAIREGRNLYYYPSDTVQVVAVSTNPNRTLLENQAIKAGVPIQIKTQGPSSLGLPADSMDAVVSVYAFRNIPDEEVKDVLREAVKVLQPGKPFIFVEPVGARNPIVEAAQKTLQGLLKLMGSKTTLTRDMLQQIQEVDELEDLEYEEILNLFDPHLVGVAKKKFTIGSAPQDSISVKRGFKKSKS